MAPNRTPTSGVSDAPKERSGDSGAPGGSPRKLNRKVDPAYPEIARRMNIAGSVKVYAVVAPDGSVKSVEPVGGSPLLVQASVDAIKRWKFAPATAESKELIELHFHPE